MGVKPEGEPATNVLTGHLVHSIWPGRPRARVNIMVVDNSGCATELHRITRLGRSRQVSLSRRATPHIWTWLRRGRGIAYQHPNPAEIDGSHHESTGYDTYDWFMWLAWTRSGVRGPPGDMRPCRPLGRNCPSVPMDQRPCHLHACPMPQPYGHFTCTMHSKPAITGLTKPVGACGSQCGGQRGARSKCVPMPHPCQGAPAKEMVARSSRITPRDMEHHGVQVTPHLTRSEGDPLARIGRSLQSVHFGKAMLPQRT